MGKSLHQRKRAVRKSQGMQRVQLEQWRESLKSFIVEGYLGQNKLFKIGSKSHQVRQCKACTVQAVLRFQFVGIREESDKEARSVEFLQGTQTLTLKMV